MKDSKLDTKVLLYYENLLEVQLREISYSLLLHTLQQIQTTFSYFIYELEMYTGLTWNEGWKIDF